MPIIERLISVIAPHQCVVCGSEGPSVCDWCFEEAAPPVPSRCYRCLRATEESTVCKNCRRTSKLKHVWVATTYEQAAKELLHRLKFQRAQAAAEPVTRYMHQTLPWLDESAIFCHIPAATARIRGRGYDQAERIARRLSNLRRRSQMALLARISKHRQVGASRQQRLAQLEGSFRIRRPDIIRGAHIILVDDVITTGATLEEAAKTLKKAGAKQVDAVVFAQVVLAS